MGQSSFKQRVSSDIYRLLRATIPPAASADAAKSSRPYRSSSNQSNVRTAAELDLHEQAYSLTTFGQEYLVPSSPVFYGSQLDNLLEGVKTGVLANYDKLRAAILTDKPQSEWGQDIFNYATPTAIERGEAERTVNTFHARSLAPSTAWPHDIDLSGHSIILDIGGASGAHAMGAVTVWPNLKGLVLDFEPVCLAAEPVIASHGLSGRVAPQTSLPMRPVHHTIKP